MHFDDDLHMTVMDRIFEDYTIETGYPIYPWTRLARNLFTHARALLAAKPLLRQLMLAGLS
jgi:hypothetical protein